MRSFLLLLTCLLQLSLSGQIKELSPAMQLVLDQCDDEDEFPIFITAENSTLTEMEAMGEGVVLGKVASYTLIRTSAGYLQSLVNRGLLTYVGLDYHQGRPLNDQMVLNNNIFPLHEGVAPLGIPLTGEGVIMGIVDTGIELSHPDFLNEDGTTRVIELWDHAEFFDTEHVHPIYGYGTVWTQAEIDAGESFHQDQFQWNGHGSTVTGTACGNGSAIDYYGGVAPKSDMVIVSFDFGLPSFKAHVVNSVEYIFNKAAELDRPVVVNLSLGDYSGSHDGLDPAALYIDSLLDVAPGRLAVAAVGNSNHYDPYHLKVELESDTAFTWFETTDNQSSSTSMVFFELWADTADFSGVNFTVGSDKVIDGYELMGLSPWKHFSEVVGTVTQENIMNSANQVIGTVQYWAQLRGAQVQLQVNVQQPIALEYAIRFMSAGTGGYDAWSSSLVGTSNMIQADSVPSVAQYPAIANYRAPDALQHMVDSWACSEKVITVGNYTNRVEYVNYIGEISTVPGTEGDIFISSSAGPTRDGRVKPDLAASGSVTLSAGNFPVLNALIQNEPFKVAQGGYHMRNGGSSMASPVVAGVGALFLEQCPGANWEDFRTALHSTAAVDAFTGQVPNPRWGMGKLNGFGAVSYESIVPWVIQSGDSLIASGGSTYQWYLEGQLLPGMTDHFILIQEVGNYQVEVFDENGCSRFSEQWLYTDLPTSVRPILNLFPNPTDGVFRLSGLLADDTVRMKDSYGREISLASRWSSGSQLDIRDLATGVYLLEIHSGSRLRILKVIKE